MDLITQSDQQHHVPEFLAGGGEMGQLIRDFDWSRTSLGPANTWPQSLRTCIRIMLTSRQPIWIGWGKDLLKFYNDPYKAIVGGKHPWALGSPVSVVWKDIWKDIAPLLDTVMNKDEGIYVESQLLVMERNGYAEETYYTFSYTPIPGDDGVTAGLICANTDDTERIISERQLMTLTELGSHVTDTQTEKELVEQTITTVRKNPYDFPFTIFYRSDENRAVFAAATDDGEFMKDVPQEIDLQDDSEVSRILQQAMVTRKIQIFEDLQERIGVMPMGAWEIPPDKAIILPIIQTGSKEPYGFLIVGLNPYRLLDEKYSGFFSLVADQVATSFYNIHALEEERRRAAALAEADMAKTTFFSNISHEFRTPLTLLLGPVEEALHDSDTLPKNKIRLAVALRNARRMQKLVNTLLEFSRIEAGKAEGRFVKTDLAAFTQDLAGSFRSAIEKAGMRLEVKTSKVQDDVYVDRDMWEKIVLNLVSNAFKYSHSGVITVGVDQVGDQVAVSVSDTGIGIPHDQLEKIFDRFHRVSNNEGRSQEGTGIGLAMVKELVRLHHGTIEVESSPGAGSTFTVLLPTGKTHLPEEKIEQEDADQYNISESLAYTEEAMKWTEDEKTSAAITAGDRYLVLLADDNADMRGYVERLLSDQFYVVTAVDGEDAFEKMKSLTPDLLLSDVMMPKMDGFQLLSKVRSTPETKHIPVIFLSARAGEEAKVEGLEAGADDYLVKPFSAKELIARVDANIKINVSRRKVAELLEEEVKKRTRQLSELNISLQQSNNDLEQFAHVASHDLKEPLRKIKTFMGRLADDSAAVLSDRSKVYLSKVDSATDRLFKMVEGVLHYSMLNSTDQKNEQVDLNNVFKNIVADLELAISRKNAVIRYDHLPKIEGAEVLIYQLFYNLVNNSLKFSREQVPPEIIVTSSMINIGERAFAELKLADNGIGFEQSQAELIFNTFARLNSKDLYEGTGLGLALCKRIVHRHGGTITAQAKRNDGAQFIVRLPLRQAVAII